MKFDIRGPMNGIKLAERPGTRHSNTFEISVMIIFINPERESRPIKTFIMLVKMSPIPPKMILEIT